MSITIGAPGLASDLGDSRADIHAPEVAVEVDRDAFLELHTASK